MRDFLAFCALMACIIVVLISFIALFKPLPKLKLATRKQAMKGFGVAFLLLVATAIIIPAPTKTEGEAPVATAENNPTGKEGVEAVQSDEPALPFKADEFSSRFNAMTAKLDKPWQMKISADDTGVFTSQANDNLVVSGSVDKEGYVKSLLAIGTGDGSVNSGLDVFVYFSAIYCAANNIADPKKCGQPLMDLVGKFEDGGKSVSTIINDVEFSYTRSEKLGNWLSVEPAN